jgi:peptidoglycan/LPS O-acetylase OafA/YrhL
MAIVFAALIAGLVYEPRRTMLKRLLEWHPIVWMGRRSYGIYLYYLPSFYLLSPLHTKFTGLASQICYIGLGFALPITLAALSYHYVEIPFLKRKVQLKWNFLQPQVPVPPLAAVKAAT